MSLQKTFEMQKRIHVLLTVLLLFGYAYFGIAQFQTKPIIIIEAFADSVVNFSGIVSAHYPNGSPKLWKTLVNGKADGLWLEWYPDGVLRYRAYWKNNLGYGRWEYFHPNGKLRSESYYIDDLAEGIYRSYHENGQLQNDASYFHGKKEGIELVYDETGILVKRSNYRDGQLVIDQPIMFEPGIISATESNEWGICFTPDGNTAYFTRRDLSTGQKRIYETSKTATGWSMPKIAPFSTDEDEAPFITQDGLRLFFASFRPLPDGSTTVEYDSNIWFVDKTTQGWSTPKPVAGSVNRSMKQKEVWPANYEAGPVIDSVGNLYFWTKSRQTNSSNLYKAQLNKQGRYENPIELIEPSSHSFFDSSPIVSPDGTILFFSSDNRPEGVGGTDIFYSRLVDGNWSRPKSLAPQIINTYFDESCAGFSPDGKYFYFSSTRSGNKDSSGEFLWDIFYIETAYLILE
jgi:hypothetical protein